jgi:hypothetical protein
MKKILKIKKFFLLRQKLFPFATKAFSYKEKVFSCKEKALVAGALKKFCWLEFFLRFILQKPK